MLFYGSSCLAPSGDLVDRENIGMRRRLDSLGQAIVWLAVGEGSRWDFLERAVTWYTVGAKVPCAFDVLQVDDRLHVGTGGNYLSAAAVLLYWRGRVDRENTSMRRRLDSLEQAIM